VADAESDTPTLPSLTDLPAGLRLFEEGKSVALRYRGDGTFHPIEFPERRWQESNYDLRYHVFTSENERVTVPAISAIDAITKSGIDKPFKIVRGLASSETVAAVIHAGRLVPIDQPEVDAGSEENAASEAAEDEPPAGVEGAETDADEAVAETETDAATEPETEEETP